MPGGEGWVLFAAVVPGICWYEDRRGQVHCLPARTAVPGVLALRPNGPNVSYLQLTLPSGTLALDGRWLPLRPLEVGSRMTLPPADLPWRPERPQQGVVDLSQDWRMLFREQRAFTAWGGASGPFVEAQRACERALGSRPTLRAGASRREVRFIYPQLAPAHLCYRLARAFADSPLRARCAMVVAEGELALTGPDGWTATAGVDALGWRVVLRRGPDAPNTLRQPGEAVEAITAKGAVWEAVVSPERLGTASRSLILG